MLLIVVLLTILKTAAPTINSAQCLTKAQSGVISGKTCYRTYDGTYNNLDNKNWGSAGSTYERLLKNSYSDGRHAYPRSVSGEELTNPRKISLTGYPDVIRDDSVWTLFTVMWGQLAAHDMSLTYGVPQTMLGTNGCCSSEGKFKFSANPRCDAIELPETDPYNIPEGRECMNFIRTQAVPGSPYEQRNEVTAFLDMSPVYGSSKNEACSLRSFENGKLKTTEIDNKQYLPTTSASGQCTVKNDLPKNYCFKAGDTRVNQNPPLALIHTILVRAHNKIAETLCTKINKQWDDEKCYQETRRIIIALGQHITYYDFLRFILGSSTIREMKINYENANGYISDYNKTVNPSVLNEHATAAFRLYHSSIKGFLKLYYKDRKEGGTLRLSDWFDNASILVGNNTFLKLALGQSIQAQGKADRFIDSEVTQFLFRYDNILGIDLYTTDINRGRDHGLGKYVAALVECGLSEPKSFDDFEKFMKPEYVDILKRLYNNYEDVELIVAGFLEDLLPDAISGPTFNCIMAKQFLKTRIGDRYFFENDNQPCPFTLDQLNSIRESGTLASLICNTVEGMENIQKDAFMLISDSNPIVECSSLPKIDLSLWAESDANTD